MLKWYFLNEYSFKISYLILKNRQEVESRKWSEKRRPQVIGKLHNVTYVKRNFAVNLKRAEGR